MRQNIKPVLFFGGTLAPDRMLDRLKTDFGVGAGDDEVELGWWMVVSSCDIADAMMLCTAGSFGCCCAIGGYPLPNPPSVLPIAPPTCHATSIQDQTAPFSAAITE